MKKIKKYSIVICSLIVSSMVLFGCDNTDNVVVEQDNSNTDIIIEENNSEVVNVNDEEITSETGVEIVEYSGEAYYVLNNNEYDESDKSPKRGRNGLSNISCYSIFRFITFSITLFCSKTTF